MIRIFITICIATELIPLSNSHAQMKKTGLLSLSLNHSVYMYIKNNYLKRVIKSWCGTFPSSAANVTLRQKRKYLWFYTPVGELDTQRCEFEKKTFLIFKCIQIQ